MRQLFNAIATNVMIANRGDRGFARNESMGNRLRSFVRILSTALGRKKPGMWLHKPCDQGFQQPCTWFGYQRALIAIPARTRCSSSRG